MQVYAIHNLYNFKTQNYSINNWKIIFFTSNDQSSEYLVPSMVKNSDAPIMIFRGRFRYRFFSSKLADSDSDTDFFSFKQPTRNNERF